MTVNPSLPAGPGASIGRYMHTEPFWEGARAGRLMLQYCTATSRYQFYPRPTSAYSGRHTLQWRQATGRGRLAAWSVDRLSATGGVPPRIHAYVDLDEGVRLLTWLVDCDPGALTLDQPLEVRWVPLPDGQQWPAFTPRATAASLPSDSRQDQT